MASPKRGEIKIGLYIVDGFEEVTRTVYEFYGCYWHRCPACYPKLGTETHPHSVECTYHLMLYEQTQRREYELREQGYQVVSLWEHEFGQQLQEESELQNFIKDLEFQDPLNPQEALYGGRTKATRGAWTCDPCTPSIGW